MWSDLFFKRKSIDKLIDYGRSKSSNDSNYFEGNKNTFFQKKINSLVIRSSRNN